MKHFLIRYLAISLAAMSIFSSTQARFHVTANHTILPETVVQPYSGYHSKETAFLDHLKSCNTFTVQMRNPQYPDQHVVKTIHGWQGEWCQVVFLTRPNNTPKAQPQMTVCQFNKMDLKMLTRPEEYDFLSGFVKNNYNSSDSRAYLSPAQKLLYKTRCKA
ncbi:MAG: hypothetical protein DHS20C10_00030 [marine bacterium B5-7]|nr:MAG: hypothetical protein DHS20C10_00030 [marine bacterium B5-7]